jgi:hypothetical protein
VGDATGPNVLLDIVKDSTGVQLLWFNFHTGRAITGTMAEWRLLNLAGGIVSTTSSYQKLGKRLSAAEWRAMWPSPVTHLLARYEARTLDIEDEVVVDIYCGWVHQLALTRLEENEHQVDALLRNQAELKCREAYREDLKAASIVRDALEARRASMKLRLSRGAHAPSFGLYKPGIAPLLTMPQRMAGMQEVDEIEMALELWLESFPMLSRFTTDKITADNIRLTLQKIKSDIQQTRKDLVGDGVHGPKLSSWELTNVLPDVDATLGTRAKAVVEAENKSRARWGLATAGATVALSIGVLFLPGGVFLDAAIGIGLVASSWEEAAILGRASNTGLPADAGLVTLFHAHIAQFTAMMGTVLLVVGTAVQGLRLLRRWRALSGIAGVEAAGMTPMARSSFASFFLGHGVKPTNAEVEHLLQQAWALLKGDPLKMPTISVRNLAKNVDGQFSAWVGKFGDIEIAARAASRGKLRGTVFHEALHARMAQWFPTLAGKASKFGPKYKLFAHIDEIAAYAFGGFTRLKQGATVSDKFLGMLELLLSPWMAYGSLQGFLEAAPLLLRDMVLITLMFYWLSRMAESRSREDMKNLFPAQPTSP